MKFWKKFGWFMLGLVPAVAVFVWQILASSVGMIIYFIQRMAADVAQGMSMDMGQEEMNQYVLSLTSDFTSGPSYNLLMFAVYIGYLVFFGLWFWLMFCRKKQTGDWKQVLKPQRVIGIVGCGIALQLALSMALTVILPLMPKIFESYSAVMDALGNESVWMILCVCILAPIGEELIFRGLTLRIMRKAIPLWAAVIVQALLFGIYHMNLVQGVYAFLLGLLFGYIAYRYGSVVPGILLHMVVNSSSYLIGYLLPDSLEGQTLIMILIGIVAFLVTMGFSYLTVRGTSATEPGSVDTQSIPAN
ncbi:MAG: CPBP family intramembrane metalloprotease [Lachnospiraceae bacterium]|nr:CPBP family intramembrane metalloprotease [Lachnospiraceae bacterium]